MTDLESNIKFVDYVIDHWLGAYWAFIVLGVSFVGLRLFARWKTAARGAWGLDDSLILLALIFFLLFMILSVGMYSAITQLIHC